MQIKSVRFACETDNKVVRLRSCAFLLDESGTVTTTLSIDFKLIYGLFDPYI